MHEFPSGRRQLETQGTPMLVMVSAKLLHRAMLAIDHYYYCVAAASAAPNASSLPFACTR